MIGLNRLEQMQAHLDEEGKLGCEQELLTCIKELRADLSYAYSKILWGFKYNSFDFSVLRRQAEEWEKDNCTRDRAIDE